MGKCNISASQELTKLLRDLLKVQNANNKLTKSKKPTVLKNWLKDYEIDCEDYLKEVKSKKRLTYEENIENYLGLDYNKIIYFMRIKDEEN